MANYVTNFGNYLSRNCRDVNGRRVQNNQKPLCCFNLMAESAIEDTMFPLPTPKVIEINKDKNNRTIDIIL